MRLVVDNIGKVKHADIEIDGITVVAGENNTGKSTLGKTLWCVFNSFHNLETRIHEERKRRIERELGRVLGIRNQLWCQGDWMGMVGYTRVRSAHVGNRSYRQFRKMKSSKNIK